MILVHKAILVFKETLDRPGNGIASITDNGDGTFTINYTDGGSFTTSDFTGPVGPQGPTGMGADIDDFFLQDTTIILISDQDTFEIKLNSCTVDTYLESIEMTVDSIYYINNLGDTLEVGAVSDFVGPQGDPGPQGTQGDPGPQGDPGVQGPAGNGIASVTDNGDGTFTINYTDGGSFTTSDFTGPVGPQGPTGMGADIDDFFLQDTTIILISDQDTFEIKLNSCTVDTYLESIEMTVDSIYYINNLGDTLEVESVSDIVGPQGPQGDPGIQGDPGPTGNGIASITDNGDGTFTINYTDGGSFTTSDFTGPVGPQGPNGMGADIDDFFLQDTTIILISDQDTFEIKLNSCTVDTYLESISVMNDSLYYINNLGDTLEVIATTTGGGTIDTSAICAACGVVSIDPIMDEEGLTLGYTITPQNGTPLSLPTSFTQNVSVSGLDGGASGPLQIIEQKYDPITATLTPETHEIIGLERHRWQIKDGTSIPSTLNAPSGDTLVALIGDIPISKLILGDGLSAILTKDADRVAGGQFEPYEWMELNVDIPTQNQDTLIAAECFNEIIQGNDTSITANVISSFGFTLNMNTWQQTIQLPVDMYIDSLFLEYRAVSGIENLSLGIYTYPSVGNMLLATSTNTQEINTTPGTIQKWDFDNFLLEAGVTYIFNVTSNRSNVLFEQAGVPLPEQSYIGAQTLTGSSTAAADWFFTIIGQTNDPVTNQYHSFKFKSGLEYFVQDGTTDIVLSSPDPVWITCDENTANLVSNNAGRNATSDLFDGDDDTGIQFLEGANDTLQFIVDNIPVGNVIDVASGTKWTLGGVVNPSSFLGTVTELVNVPENSIYLGHDNFYWQKINATDSISLFGIGGSDQTLNEPVRNFNLNDNTLDFGKFEFFHEPIRPGATQNSARLRLSPQHPPATGWLDDDVIGAIDFHIYDTSANGPRTVASIRAVNQRNGVGNITTSGELAFYTSPWNDFQVETMRLDQNGRLGIGVVDPSATLHVNGSVIAESTLQAEGIVRVVDNDVHVTNSLNGVILTSPDNTCWRVTIDNTGALITTSITCP